MDNMRYFRDNYIKTSKGVVLDVGALNINGTYRDLFEGFKYIGFDISPGLGVDVTDWKDIESESVDYCISGQTFEHVEDEHELMINIFNVLKPGGLICIIAPSCGPKHDFPQDYRRYQPSDMEMLADITGFDVIEARINGRLPWNDCMLIGRKPL
jgi:SAM-dependent methyltransferase